VVVAEREEPLDSDDLPLLEVLAVDVATAAGATLGLAGVAMDVFVAPSSDPLAWVAAGRSSCRTSPGWTCWLVPRSSW